MYTIKGKYTSADIFTVNTENPVDDHALSQIRAICDNPVSVGSKIKIMPDVHAGKIVPIGFTMTVGEKIMPNLVGIDIGCGVTCAKLSKSSSDWKKLDSVIRENVPSGFEVRKKRHIKCDFDFSRLQCGKHINKNAAELSLGTLGSGNHFIEIDKDADGNFYVLIHSGSRHLGKETAEYYLNEGKKLLNGIPYELVYIESDLKDAYISDTKILCEYAELNRQIILFEILKGMKWKAEEVYSSTHNYIDTVQNVPIIRKGAISALEGEKTVIPINMRDGVILGEGLGNPEWNFSAPHGSGRILKRSEVKNNYTVSAYKTAMKGIYSPSINADTLEEAPFAYRNLEDIREVINETVKIEKYLKPCYNFKGK